MGREEVFTRTATGIDMAHHDKEACVLEVEIGIDIHDGISAKFDTTRFILLYGELSESGCIVGCFILGEESHVGSEIAFQHLCDLELEIEIGVQVECGNRQDILLA